MYFDAVSFYKLNIIATIIYAVFLLYIVLKPGTNEVNKYGNKPEKLFDLGSHNFEEKKSSITTGR
ncbi:MAG: hypothetical protein MSA07_11470 [Mucispirillum sp.]|nr:hypothetical protein [Mucispirillum sp.]